MTKSILYQPLENLTPHELIVGILVLKTGSPDFDEDELEKRLRKLSDKYPKLDELFHLTCDGTPNRTHEFYDTVVTFSHYDMSSRKRYLTASTKEVLKKNFKNYDSNTLKYLQSLADEVWQIN